MTRTTTLELLCTVARRVHDGTSERNASELARDLERVEFARRTLKRAAQTMRAGIRAGTSASSEDAAEAVADAGRAAHAALAGEPWGVRAELRGANAIVYSARHARPGATTAITVTATTLPDLLAAVDAVDLDAFDGDLDASPAPRALTGSGAFPRSGAVAA